MTSIGAETLASMLYMGERELSERSDEINGMNVFPVPDGDTGSNMTMTMEGARKIPESAMSSVGGAAKAAASGMLRSARGNSGVILSVFFRGFADALSGLETAGASELANAFSSGARAAYGAVESPAEGTILTVMRESAEAGEKEALSAQCTVDKLFSSVISEASESLKRTPKLLPMLAKAGVVDAGGCGFLTVLSGMAKALNNHTELPAEFFRASSTDVSAASEADFDERYPYCTECIVEKKVKSAEPLKTFAASRGNSVVFTEDDEAAKLHVHTDDPGVVLSEALKYGSLYTVKIENMKLQHTSLKESSEAASSFSAKKYGVVTVAAGDGIASLFEELGADKVVSGGQTMNPSVEDLLEAVRSVKAETVFLLPNNKNIVFSANQAATLALDEGICVSVIPTTEIPQGISSLCMFDGGAEAEYNISEMKNAAQSVKTFAITRAVRDASIDGLEVREGQYLGLENGRVCCSFDTAENTIEFLIKRIDGETTFTVIYGEGSDENLIGAARKLLGEIKNSEISVVEGGQPLYPLIIGAE